MAGKVRRVTCVGGAVSLPCRSGRAPEFYLPACVNGHGYIGSALGYRDGELLRFQL